MACLSVKSGNPLQYPYRLCGGAVMYEQERKRDYNNNVPAQVSK
jgi:hypothetical protein